MTSTKHRLLSGFLSLLMVLLLVIKVFPPIEVVAASHSPTKLTNPSISPVQIGERLYEGYYNGEVSNSSSLTVKWKDVGQEYFNVAVKVLSGEPAPGDNENGELIYDYTTNYTKTSLSLSLKKMQNAAGKWVKVFIQAHFSDGTEIGCHYYFIVELDSPDIEVESVNKSDSLKISWDKVTGATGYDIYRSTSTSSSSFSRVKTITSGSTTSWTDSGLNADTKYYYKVKAINKVTESDFSNRDYANTDKEASADPRVNSITSSASTVETCTSVKFTIMTNKQAKYGVAIYADEYCLKERVTSKTTSGDEYKYTYTHPMFTSDGNRVIYAYPLDENYEPIKSAGAAYILTVTAENGKILPPKITTEQNTAIGSSDSLKVTWDAPSAPKSGIRYNVYLKKEDGDSELLNSSPTSNTYYNITKSMFDGEGKYIVTVYAFATGYSQSCTDLIVYVKSDPIIDFSIEETTVTVGDKIELSGEVDGNGKKINIVSIGIYSKSQNDSVYIRKENINKTAYSLDNAIQTGEVITGWDNNGNYGKTLDMTKPGIYTVTIHVKTYETSNNYFYSDSIEVQMLENTAQIISITPSVSSANTQEEVDFTIITNSNAKYGVAVYAGEYYLGKVESSTKKGSQLQYKYNDHKFNSSGKKTIYAYPLKSDKTVDMSISASCEITINASNGRIGNPVFTTADNTTITKGSSFTVSWKKLTTPSSGVTYNMYLLKDGTNNNKLVASGINGTSQKIPASELSEEGRYIITLYALASGYTQNASGAILVVNVKNDGSVYAMGVSPSVTEANTMTGVDFVIKTSPAAKYGVAIYAGKYHLTTITTKPTSYSTYNKYVYNGHNFTASGVKNIYAYPLDSNKQPIMTEGAYATCSVQINSAGGVCGTPKITTASNQIIGVNKEFTVSWNKPSSPSSGVKYNVYVWYYSSEDGEPLGNSAELVASMLSTTSFKISGNKFSGKGVYYISVYAMAPGYTQSLPADIIVNVSDGNKLKLNCTELTAHESGGNGSNITVTSNVSWTVSSDVKWITFSKSGGTGNGQFYPIIAANDSSDERVGNITVTGGGITRKITVKQSGLLISNVAQEDSVYNQKLETLNVLVFGQDSPGSKTSSALKGAKVTCGKQNVKTDTAGYATLNVSASDGNSMAVSMPGFSTVVINITNWKDSDAILPITLKLADAESKPVINAVWISNTNLLTKEYSIDLLSKTAVNITATVDWGTSSYGSLYLWQDGRQANFTGGSINVVLSEKFDVSKDIYIVAKNSAGKESREKLKFKVTGGYPEWLNKAGFSFYDKFTVKVPESVFAIGGSKFDINLEGLNSLPIDLYVEDNKVYAAIGMGIFSKESSDKYVTNPVTKDRAHTLKEEIKVLQQTIHSTANSSDAKKTISSYFKNLSSKYKQQIKYPKGSFLFNTDIKVAGFIEGYVDSNGELVILDSGLILNPSFESKWGKTLSVPVGPVIVPVVVEAAFKAELTARLNLYANKAAQNFIPVGSLDGEISVSGGIGVGVANVASVTGGIKGTLYPTFTLNRNSANHFKLDAGFGAYLKIKVAIFEYQKDFDDIKRATWYEYPTPKSSFANFLSVEKQTYLSDYSNTDNYQLQDREYAEYDSEFTMNEYVKKNTYAQTQISSISSGNIVTFQTNAYSEADSVIGTFEDGTMIAVFISDDKTRSDVNRTRLYYSFYNGIEWSEPRPIDANDLTADFSPSITVTQNKAFITWQNATKVFSDKDNLDTIAPYFDIGVAIFDPSSKNIVTHTVETKGLDMMPVICSSENTVSIVWVNNTLNTWYGYNNNNSIMSYTFKNNSWGDVTQNKTSLKAICSIDAQYIGADLNIVYTSDSDNNINTSNDVAGYLLKNSSNTTVRAAGAISKMIIRNNIIYWQQDGNIMYCAVNGLSSVKSIFDSNDSYSINSFEIVDNGTERYAVIVIGDGLYSKLGISIYDKDTGKWSKISNITNGNSYVSDHSSIITDDGFVKIIATRTEVIGTIDDVKPYGLSDIIVCTVSIDGDLRLDDVSFDMSKSVSDTTAEIYAHVTNTGKEVIKGSVITIYDKNGNVVTTSIDDTVINPGESADLHAFMNIDRKIIGTNVTVTVKPKGINDINLADNSKGITVDYYDVAVENIGFEVNSSGNAVIYAGIANRGYRIEKNLTVSLRKGAADATPISTVNISSIESFNSSPVQFTVNYESGAVYYITVSESIGDMMVSNNKDFVVLTSDGDDTVSYLRGDVNGNGVVNIQDATILLRYVNGWDGYDKYITNMVAADLSGDGLVLINDATILLRYANGWNGYDKYITRVKP